MIDALQTSAYWVPARQLTDTVKNAAKIEVIKCFMPCTYPLAGYLCTQGTARNRQRPGHGKLKLGMVVTIMTAGEYLMPQM